MEPVSVSQRSMLIMGVMQLPAPSSSRRLGSPERPQVKWPDAPLACTSHPGCTWSCSQLEPRPPGSRFTLMATVCGRDGDDDSV